MAINPYPLYSLAMKLGINRIIFYFFWGILISFFSLNCTTVSPKNERAKGSTESAQEVTEALQSVAGAISGQEIDKKKLRDLAVDMKTNPETQSAVNVVTESLRGQNIEVKYCPVDGKRFSGTLERCPEHGVILKKVE